MSESIILVPESVVGFSCKSRVPVEIVISPPDKLLVPFISRVFAPTVITPLLIVKFPMTFTLCHIERVPIPEIVRLPFTVVGLGAIVENVPVPETVRLKYSVKCKFLSVPIYSTVPLSVSLVKASMPA